MSSNKYIGKICAKHPTLGGERYVNSHGSCVGCIKAGWKKRRDESKHGVIHHYSKGKMCCGRCGIDDIDVLTIDHIKQNGAAHRRAHGLRGMSGGYNKGGKGFYRWLKRNGYPPGFRVRCFNCNIKEWLRHVRN